jgi:predicted nucleic acid-binding protein
VNGIDFFVDTNVLIYILNGHRAVAGITHFPLAISVISEIELLGKKDITPFEIDIIRNLLNDCEIIKLTNSIKEIAISLKQKYSVKIPDAIIAATAKSFDLPLITADIDLKKIEGVNILLLDLYKN